MPQSLATTPPAPCQPSLGPGPGEGFPHPNVENVDNESPNARITKLLRDRLPTDSFGAPAVAPAVWRPHPKMVSHFQRPINPTCEAAPGSHRGPLAVG